jgi:hypothetical protein
MKKKEQNGRGGVTNLGRTVLRPLWKSTTTTQQARTSRTVNSYFRETAVPLRFPALENELLTTTKSSTNHLLLYGRNGGGHSSSNKDEKTCCIEIS